MTRQPELHVRVDAVQQAAERTKSFRLVSLDGTPLPAFSAGSHVTVLIDDGTRLLRNPYSLTSSPAAASGGYEITVLRVADSRGGSAYLHDQVRPGTELRITTPANLFPVHQIARKHLLVAGGIGITPFVPMTAQLAALGATFELHHAMRSTSAAPFAAELQQAYGARVHHYVTGRGERVPVAALVADQPLGTHLYVCGPEGMIDQVLEQARDAGWPEESLHSERFVSPPAGDPFTVQLARAGLRLRVGEHESVLEAVEAAGLQPPYLCRGGACGQCETPVLAFDGELQHHDHYLTESERRAGRSMLICMSRLRGHELTLDL